MAPDHDVNIHGVFVLPSLLGVNREHDSGAREEDPVTPGLVEGGSQDQSSGCVSVM